MLVDNKILPVLVIHDQKKAIDLAKCLYDSGIRNIEIALRTDSSKKSVDKIVNSQIPLNIGIGTILTIDDLIFAKQVGVLGVSKFKEMKNTMMTSTLTFGIVS